MKARHKQTVKIKCKSFIKPTWFHDDVWINTDDIVSKNKRRNIYTLKITKIKEADAGNYKCFGFTKELTPFRSISVVFVDKKGI